MVEYGMPKALKIEDIPFKFALMRKIN